MKIGIEVQRLFRRKKHGMEIVALEILQELQKMKSGQQYTVYVKDDVDRNCLKESANLKITVPSNSVFPIWEQKDLLRSLRSTKPELLHCTSNTAPLFCKVPMVITIHDIIYLESINFSGSIYQNFGNLYRRFIVPKIARKAAMILTVSEYEKRVIVDRLRISEDKVRVVYNGVNQQFRPITDTEGLAAFRAKYELPDRFLLHFANTAPKKNTIGVLSAFAMYNERVANPLPLVLTDCRREHIADLLNQINAPQLMNNIKILDYVPFSSIPYLYNLATVFLYPSHRESFGMPLIEAMACGVPVITGDSSALPEIAGGAACMVNTKKPEELCEQIIRLLSDEKLYHDNRAKGFRNAERFSWKLAAEKTAAIYNELAGAANAAQHYKYSRNALQPRQVISQFFSSRKDFLSDKVG